MACWFSDMIDGASCGSASLRTRLPNGSPGKSARHVVGRARHNISSATGTASTARHLRAAFERCGIATDPTAPRFSAEPPMCPTSDRLDPRRVPRSCDRVRRASSASGLFFYAHYYNGARTHPSLGRNSPLPRGVQAIGSILPLPILGGLHHHYVRISICDKRQAYSGVASYQLVQLGIRPTSVRATPEVNGRLPG